MSATGSGPSPIRGAESVSSRMWALLFMLGSPPRRRSKRLLRAPFIGRWEILKRVRSVLFDGVFAYPEVGRPFAIWYLVAHGFDAALEVCGYGPYVLVGHVAECRPRHRDGQVFGVGRKIALSRYGRSNHNVRRLTWSQPEAQGIENLALTKPACARPVIRRQVSWVGLERANLEERRR